VTGQTFNGAALQGDAKAPVTIIEYSDFQCPYCGRFVQDAYPQIEANYIKTGKAKLIFKDFPLSFHPYAQKAAVAGKCVLEQGNDKFWKYHDAVFTNQAQLNDDNIKLWASQAGADMTKFNACVASGKMDAIIQQEQQEGQQAGVTGTPSFTINGKLVVGAQPFSAFQTAIDAALAAGK
jgi:protein-disulfide isomerase